MKECGGCTMCCKIIGVSELDKSPNEWCKHCDIGEGCSIYKDAPDVCHDFKCLWLVSEDMPDELRPDKTKVVLGGTTDGKHVVAYVDPARPDAYKQGRIGMLLGSIAALGPVFVVCGDKRRMLTGGFSPME